MSILGMSLLAEIIQKDKIIQPDLILNRLREYLIHSLHQKEAQSNHKEGMSIAVCLINREKGNVLYSGASMPIAVVKKENNYEVERITPDKMPISISPKMIPFNLKSIDMHKSDMLYLFTDGYADQFGGPEGKKYRIKPFLNILDDISHKPLNIQLQSLENILDNWINESETRIDQFDDITIMGVRL